jgi:hypothetical protein
VKGTHAARVVRCVPLLAPKSIDVEHELTLPSVRDLINQLAVIIGHCDLLSDHLPGGSECAQRVSAIQEIAQRLAREFNKYQCQLSKSA